jgi:hypothetical protein
MTTPQGLIKQATTICEAATPGPWDVRAHLVWNGIDDDSIQEPQLAVSNVPICSQKDIDFINVSRTLVEQLAEALKTRIAEALVSDDWISVFAQDYATLEMRAETLKAENEARTRERDEARAEAASLKLQVENYEKATDLFTRET